MHLLDQNSHSTIKNLKITIANHEFFLPVAIFKTDSPIHILISGGVDGDEYTAIEAAYRLIAQYASKAPPVSVTILPLVNIPGFYSRVSYNPLDKLYPKHIYPGKKTGKPSEQLLYTLSERYINNSTVWIDLHSGSLHEDLTPFIWGYKTKNSAIDNTTERILSQIKADKKVYHSSPFPKITSLAKKEINYLMLEAGERGGKESKDIETLTSWTNEIINVIAKNEIGSESFSAYTFVDEYVSPKEGLWYPKLNVGEQVQKGERLGVITSLQKKDLAVIRAKTDGMILWQRSSLPVEKENIIVGIGVKAQSFTKDSR